MDTQEIKRIVLEIRRSRIPNKEMYFRKQYPKFVEDFPKLFLAALNKDFPLTYLDIMLNQINTLTKDEASLDAADKVVYAQLRKDYVEPIVGKIDESQIAQLAQDALLQNEVANNNPVVTSQNEEMVFTNTSEEAQFVEMEPGNDMIIAGN